MSHIENLEDTVIALLEEEDDIEKFEKAQRVAKKIKRKRQERRKKLNEDSDTSNESQSYCKPPRFKKSNISNNTKNWGNSQEPEKINVDQNKDMEIEEDRKNESPLQQMS